MSRNKASATEFSLQRQIEGVTRKMNEVTYTALAVVVTRVDELSPVGDTSLWKNPPPKDYVGGQFRGNWQMGVDYRPIGDLPGKIDPSGSATVSANIAAIPAMASRHKFYFVNNLPYALRIEQGWSTQWPMLYFCSCRYPQIV